MSASWFEPPIFRILSCGRSGIELVLNRLSMELLSMQALNVHILWLHTELVYMAGSAHAGQEAWF